jgi:hypothetical protein
MASSFVGAKGPVFLFVDRNSSKLGRASHRVPEWNRGLPDAAFFARSSESLLRDCL